MLIFHGTESKVDAAEGFAREVWIWGVAEPFRYITPKDEIQLYRLISYIAGLCDSATAAAGINNISQMAGVCCAPDSG
jgi:hypothetical protein